MTVRTHAVRNFIGRAVPAARTVRAARIGRAVPAAPAADVVAPKGRSIQAVCALLALASLCVLMPMHAQAIPALVETEALRSDVSAGKLPPIGQRIPATPVLSEYNKDILSAGKQGGTLRMLIASARDVRMLYVFGYARLVTYDRNLKIVPDILESVDVEDGRVFTLKLRKGHRWSDGHPFTTEDFRYFWEDVALNKALSPTGPPIDLLVDGQPPVVEVLGDCSVEQCVLDRRVLDAGGSEKKPHPSSFARGVSHGGSREKRLGREEKIIARLLRVRSAASPFSRRPGGASWCELIARKAVLPHPLGRAEGGARGSLDRWPRAPSPGTSLGRCGARRRVRLPSPPSSSARPIRVPSRR